MRSPQGRSLRQRSMRTLLATVAAVATAQAVTLRIGLSSPGGWGVDGEVQYYAGGGPVPGVDLILTGGPWGDAERRSSTPPRYLVLLAALSLRQHVSGAEELQPARRERSWSNK